MVQSSGYQARDTARADDMSGDLKNKANEQIEKVAGQVEAKAKAMRDQGREMTEQVQVVAENFKGAFNKSIKEQPVTTLALTAAVAFVLGALWKS